mmetsp:Transcript_13724/g.54305  ORF Transcript_13724/g.54305 Transcript_13724/m.54305 type:complete len:472 (-) Transcript_13724:105-1520(-)
MGVLVGHCGATCLNDELGVVGDDMGMVRGNLGNGPGAGVANLQVRVGADQANERAQALVHETADVLALRAVHDAAEAHGSGLALAPVARGDHRCHELHGRRDNGVAHGLGKQLQAGSRANSKTEVFVLGVLGLLSEGLEENGHEVRVCADLLVLTDNEAEAGDIRGNAILLLHEHHLALHLAKRRPELDCLHGDLLCVLLDDESGDLEDVCNVGAKVAVILFSDLDKALDGALANDGVVRPGALADEVHNVIPALLALEVVLHELKCQQEGLHRLAAHLDGRACLEARYDGVEDDGGLGLEELRVDLLAEDTKALECGDLRVLVASLHVVEEELDDVAPHAKRQLDASQLGNDLGSSRPHNRDGRGKHRQNGALQVVALLFGEVGPNVSELAVVLLAARVGDGVLEEVGSHRAPSRVNALVLHEVCHLEQELGEVHLLHVLDLRLRLGADLVGATQEVLEKLLEIHGVSSL